MSINPKRVRFNKARNQNPLMLFVSRLVVLLVLCTGFAQVPIRAQTVPANAVLSFPLTFEEKGTTLPITLGQKEVKFRKEPDFGRDRVMRRALPVGSDKSDFIGFAADLTRKTLYLDLNQNLDLTDDADGVRQGTGSAAVNFQGIRIDLTKKGISRSYVLDFDFSSTNSVIVYCRSFFEGNVELHGQTYRIEVYENLDGQFDAGDRFKIVPIAGPPITDSQPVPQNLLLGSHQYHLSFAFANGPEAPPLTARFAEFTSPMADLALDGSFIRRLVLSGDELIILDSPSSAVQVPEGKYRVQAVSLQVGDSRMLQSDEIAGIPQLALAPNSPGRLKIGAPLESSVTATASGSILRLQYVLKGAGGESYALANTSRANPPKWAVYQGDRRLAGGNFEFG